MQKKKSVKAWWELHGWGVIGLGCHLDLFIAQCLSQECHSCGLKYERRLFVKSNVQHVGHKRWQWRWWCGCKHRNAFFPPFFFIVVQLHLSPFWGFTNHLPWPTHPTSHFQSCSPIVFDHGSFIRVPWWSFPFTPLFFPSFLPSGHCQFVPYFYVSDSILLACLFCWLGST